MNIQKTNEGYLISNPWSRFSGIGLLIFGLIWTSFSSFFLYMTNSQLKGNFSPLDLLFIIVPGFFILIGIGLLYTALGNILNKTKLLLSEDELLISNGPIPFFNKKRIWKNQVQQIFIIDSAKQNSKGVLPAYLNQDGQRQYLFGQTFSLPNPCFLTLEEARTLEELIEDFWGIQDAPIKDELPKYSTRKELPNFLEEAETQRENSPQSFSDLQKLLKARPNSILTDFNQDGLFLVKSWYSPIGYLLLAFGLIWTSITGSFSFFLFQIYLEQPHSITLFAIAFLMIFVGIGLWLLRRALINLVNSSQFQLNTDFFSLRHRPLRAGRKIHIPIQDIEYWDFVEEKVVNNTKNGTSISYIYPISVQLRNGERQQLFDASLLSISQEESEYLVQVFNSALQQVRGNEQEF
ncbi:hypothetical protein SapgrDRAFT_1823 [Saprospira grandis DSM 2844]|uniref:Uncharacterized protein n=1 Tax=Saprospira grandis DSM 2844 TaxID=694433 RepID=J0XWT9_9BACT|nr:hypothetical protein [Saprospira grandis]EJF53526.1 hypothetical protein SapgrDRAFT_1823 [Saprospira grandis DSM 2844]